MEQHCLEKAEERFERTCLEEYRALRNESLRSAQIIANTIWIGASGFVATLGLGTALLRSQPAGFPVVVALLCVQALAASMMFLSEVWKYIRVGTYIRDKIETRLSTSDPPSLENSPLYWEHWISKRRSTWFYLASISVLQLPILAAIIVLAFPCSVERFLPLRIPRIWVPVIWSLVGIDLGLVFIMGVKIIALLRLRILANIITHLQILYHKVRLLIDKSSGPTSNRNGRK